MTLPAAGGDVAVIGESLVDIVTDPSGARTVHPGGSPLNVAVGLARLGVRTSLSTHIGQDASGEQVRAHLAESGVSVDVLGPEAAPTASALAVLKPDGSAEYTFEVTWDPTLRLPGSPALVHTGSLATSLAPGADAVETLLRDLDPETLVSFDPNIRPSLAPSRSEMRDRVERIASLAHLVKMSDEDATWLHPEDSVEELIRRHTAGSGGLFLLTRGAEGCTFGTAEWSMSMPAPAVDVVDTIGAGDAFMSGLLYAVLSSGLAPAVVTGDIEAADIAGCVRTALQSAAHVVSRPGANPPTLTDLEEAGPLTSKTL